MIKLEYLEREYVEKQKSANEIAKVLDCSTNKVNYWLHKHNIDKRSISDAVYMKSNPAGDPFKVKKPITPEEWFLYGLGLGLFWGEGNKVNKHSVRLGNTDPGLIKKFLEFLNMFYKVDQSKLRFGIQIFSDVSKAEALKFWMKELQAPRQAFQKVVVTKSGKVGTYRKKNLHGVLTVYFSNVKLRDIIVSAIRQLQEEKPS